MCISAHKLVHYYLVSYTCVWGHGSSQGTASFEGVVPCYQLNTHPLQRPKDPFNACLPFKHFHTSPATTIQCAGVSICSVWPLANDSYLGQGVSECQTCVQTHSTLGLGSAGIYL